MAKRVGVDKLMFCTTLSLVLVGLAMVFSASAVVAQVRYHSPFAFVGRQGLWAILGLLVMVILMNIDVRRYNSPKFVYPALCLTLLLLIAVYFFPGSHNTHRWIRFGDLFTFQPSEIAKPVIIIFLAWFLQKRLDHMRDWKKTLIPAVSIPTVCMFLVGAQPDLGTALVLAGVTTMMLILAGLDWKFVATSIFVVAIAAGTYIYFTAWRLRRVLAFLNPDADPQGAGFHINQSLIAVGTGGLTGHGYMEGIQKLFYLPEASTDFIFANIAEEWGFMGSILLLALFAFFGVRGFRAAFRSPDSFARLVAFGITTTILLQAFFNISVVLSLLPTKGIPLPLISSGGTSLFCTLASIGVLLNITRHAD